MRIVSRVESILSPAHYVQHALFTLFTRLRKANGIYGLSKSVWMNGFRFKLSTVLDLRISYKPLNMYVLLGMNGPPREPNEM